MFDVAQILPGRSCFLVAAAVPKVASAFPIKAMERSDECGWLEAAVAKARPHPACCWGERRQGDCFLGLAWASRSGPIFKFNYTGRFAGQSPLPKNTIDYPWDHSSQRYAWRVVSEINN